MSNLRGNRGSGPAPEGRTERDTSPIRILLASLMLAAGISSAAAQVEGEVGIPLGSVPAAVVIEDLDGQPVDLGKFIGKKPVLFEFWATWCAVCEALEPEMIRAHEEYGDRVEFVAIAVAINQSKRSIRRHLEDHSLPFELLWDTRGRATRELKAPTTSYVVMLDAQGRVVYTGVGEDQSLDMGLEKLVGSDPTGGGGRQP